MKLIPVILRKQDRKEILGKVLGVVQIAVFVSGIIGSVIGNKSRSSVIWKTGSVYNMVCAIGTVSVIDIVVIGLDETYSY